MTKPLASVATHASRHGNYRSVLRVFLPSDAFLPVFLYILSTVRDGIFPIFFNYIKFLKALSSGKSAQIPQHQIPISEPGNDSFLPCAEQTQWFHESLRNSSPSHPVKGALHQLPPLPQDHLPPYQSFSKYDC